MANKQRTPRQKVDDLTAYRIDALEKANDKLEIRVNALELWQAGVDAKTKEVVNNSNNSLVTPSKDWIKIIVMILTGLLALITYITSQGGN